MGLTFRDIKGSSLTIEEADGNFRYLTGSHEISGSLTISGSLLPSSISATLGSADSPWKEIFVSGSTITFIGSSSAHTASISMTPDLRISSSFTGSFSGDGSRLVNVQNSNVDGAPYQYGETGTGPIEPVLGSNDSTSNYATIGGGQLNVITSSFCNFVETGSDNSFIGGGRRNQITGSKNSFIVGGYKNSISCNNRDSSIAGGSGNNICLSSPPDFTFPLVYEGTDIIQASGSSGLNSIGYGNFNRITSSAGSTAAGIQNFITKHNHSTATGWLNCIYSAQNTGSGVEDYSSALTIDAYQFSNFGAHVNSSFLSTIGANNKYRMGGNHIVGSKESTIYNSVNSYIGSSYKANISTNPVLNSTTIRGTDYSVIIGSKLGRICANDTTPVVLIGPNLGYANNTIIGGGGKICNSAQSTLIASSQDVIIHESRNAMVINGICSCQRNSHKSIILGGGFVKLVKTPGINYTGDDIVIMGASVNHCMSYGNQNFTATSWMSCQLGHRNQYNTMIGSCQSTISSSRWSVMLANGNSTISGWAEGQNNTLPGCHNYIGPGYNNEICVSCYTSIGGGYYNTISASNCSTIIGGQYNTMSHNDSFIIGSCLTSSYNCTTHVNNIFISGGLRDSSGDLGSSTQILSSTGTGTNWISLDAATNTTYILEVASGLGNDNAIITLSGSDQTEDNVNIIGGTGIDVSVSGDDITITNDYALNLVAGPGITVNENGANTEISASVNPDNTGSFYYSSSVVLNTITFFQGDGTTETVTVDTGSGGGGDNFHHVYQSGSTGNNIKAILGSHINSGSYATIGGGGFNKIHVNGGYSFIGAGSSNDTTGSNSFIGAGYNNCINSCGRCSVIVGGHDNNVFDDDSFIGGGHGNEVATSGNGQGWMTIGGGQFNCTGCGGATVAGGAQNDALGCLSFIGGGFCNHANACYGVIGGGRENNISSLVCRASILGGAANTVSGSFSTILGGSTNTVKGRLGNITNGYLNAICGESCYNFIGNGYINEMDTKASSSFIGGGERNCINAIGSFIGAGNNNQIEHPNPNFTASNSIIVGGSGNCVANSGIIVGGSNNCVDSSGTNGFIGGGCNNIISCINAAILAGGSNQIATGGISSVIVAGSSNKITDTNSFIGAGTSNTGSGDRSVIGGGQFNSVRGTSNQDSSILGGCGNSIIESPFSNIGGGRENLIDSTGSYNSIVGGGLNKVTGSKEFAPTYSSILGGRQNQLEHPYSFIMGRCITSDAPETTFVNNFHATGSEGSNNVITFANLPTSDPENVGQLFVTQSDASGNLNGQYVLLVSQG